MKHLDFFSCAVDNDISLFIFIYIYIYIYIILCFCGSLSSSPSGWDNEKKVSILYENFQSLKREDKFEEVIIQPPVRKVMSLPDLLLVFGTDIKY